MALKVLLDFVSANLAICCSAYLAIHHLSFQNTTRCRTPGKFYTNYGSVREMLHGLFLFL